jgi:hypothetical protein
MHHQLITRDIKTGIENPVSIRSAWPDLLKKKFKGKLRGSRSKLQGNRELDCRVIVKPAKRVTNALTKIRQEISENRAKRNRLAFVARNPDLKVGGISSKGTIQPRGEKGKFLKAVQVKY